MIETDFIIVGSGLAGTVMAHTLHREGRSFRIISDPSISKCSQIAGGIYNPIVFYRITKSYMADFVLPYAKSFYGECETQMHCTLHHSIPLGRILASEQEKILWDQRREEGPGAYLGENIQASELINAPFGIGLVSGTGYLECDTFLTTSYSYFTKNISVEKFDYYDLEIHETGVRYRDHSARHIIFCEGYMAMNNPYFRIPFKPVKGEIITLEFSTGLPEPLNNMILVKNSYLLPLGNNFYKSGGTYDWDHLDEIATPGATGVLSERVREITSIPFRIVDQQAAVRPSVSDRRPVIGTHPNHSALSVFNGLGTKGVMLAPYYANELYHAIENKRPVSKETGLSRFF
jgi:glycine oxidase